MPRPRLHISSIVVGATVAVSLVLLEVPGRSTDNRTGAYKSTTYDALLIVAVICAILGWLKYQHSEWQREIEAADAWPVWSVIEERCIVPH